MQKKKLFILYVLLALISACTASLPPVADHAQPPSKTTPLVLPAEKATSPPRESFFSRGTNKDEALFLQGLHQLLDPVATNATGNAKDTLESLINSYPRSKWRDAAVAILHLIGEVDDYHRRLLMGQDTLQKLITEKNKAIQENEQLKKDLRLLNEKYQADLAALQQENEQLKKDLQLLKNLELQLDKRGKTLR